MRMINWKRACTLVVEGRLGLKASKEMHFALLEKQNSDMKGGFWKALIRENYGEPKKSFDVRKQKCVLVMETIESIKKK